MLRRIPLHTLATFLLVTTALAQEPPSVSTAATEPRTVTALRLAAEERILLDGRLDEPVWTRAVPARDFVQQVPDNGAAPTEGTEVRFAFSRDALYMGVHCFDSEPDLLAGNTMKRDEFLRADDRFMWVFDPFLNAQSGYFFEMNPSGSMADSQMSSTGPVNREWDGIWNARARRHDAGWTLEIEIPFRTLNFDPNGRAWGVNFLRSVRRKNEDSLWTGWKFNQGLFRLQNAGLLMGISDVAQGRGLDIRPYGVALASGSPGRAGQESGPRADAGVDVYYNVTPEVRANLTVNTDFAQTEVDQRQVNLTRFSLFFPERRGFFLEGAAAFDFISSSQRFGPGGGGNDTAVVPFFSRRIGLDANGLPQPIDLGAKIAGQIGRQDLGVLQIRTADQQGAPGEDFTVLRLKRRMLKQSYVGLLYTRRDLRQADADTLSTVGLDYRLGTATFRGRQNLETTGYVLRTTNPADTGRNYAYGLAVDYPNDRYVGTMAFREVQEHYNPAVGFTLRNGYRRYNPRFLFQPRPRASRLVRQYTFGVDGDLQFTTRGNALLQREWDLTLARVQLHSQDTVEARLITSDEQLDQAFAISSGITLPTGNRYQYTRLRAQVGSANRRVVAVTTTVEVGSFYSGTREQLILNAAVRPRRGVVIYLDADFNRVALAEGRFSTRLYRAVADTQVSPWVALTNNLQYDSVSGVLGWQSRFRWILKPGRELYLVYLHNWQDAAVNGRFATLDRRFASKVFYTISL